MRRPSSREMKLPLPWPKKKPTAWITAIMENTTPTAPVAAVAAQHPHKKGVRHVVKSGHQHTDDAGNGQMGDHPAHRFFCELVEFLFLFFTHGEPSS